MNNKLISENIFNTGKTILSKTTIGYDEKRINQTQPYYNILAGFIEYFNISNVIEIGTHKGGSGLAMMKSNNNLQLVTIDVEEHTMAIERLNKYDTCKRLIGDSLSTEIRDNVKEYFKNINGKTLLYIDALKDGEWIEGKGFCEHIDEILQRISKETGIPCVKGTAHLPKGYVPQVYI